MVLFKLSGGPSNIVRNIILKYLTVWRYHQAQKRDLPIGFVAKDHTLIALAQSAPQSVSAMLSLEGIELLDVRHKGKAMLGVINQANKTDSYDYPNPIKRLDEYPGYKQIFKEEKSKNNIVYLLISVTQVTTDTFIKLLL